MERTVRKAVTIKLFKYSPLNKELKTQTNIAKDQYKFLKIKQMLLITIEKMKPRQKMVPRQKMMK